MHEPWDSSVEVSQISWSAPSLFIISSSRNKETEANGNEVYPLTTDPIVQLTEGKARDYERYSTWSV